MTVTAADVTRDVPLRARARTFERFDRRGRSHNAYFAFRPGTAFPGAWGEAELSLRACEALARETRRRYDCRLDSHRERARSRCAARGAGR